MGDMRLEWKSFKVLVEIESRGVLSKLYSFFKCAVFSHFQRKVSDFVVVPFSCR